jgi:DNA-directed RNA polymerase subunit N (RpoN/RPB10)
MDEDYNPTPLGWKQKEFEDLRTLGFDVFETLDQMGIKRLCCRERLFNCPMLFINDSDIGRIKDNTGFFTKTEKNRMTRVETLQSGEPIVPKRPFPEIPK